MAIIGINLQDSSILARVRFTAVQTIQRCAKTLILNILPVYKDIFNKPFHMKTKSYNGNGSVF